MKKTKRRKARVVQGPRSVPQSDPRSNGAADLAATHAAFDSVTTGQLLKETHEAVAEVQSVVDTWAGCHPAQTAGRVSEVFHARTLNADAIRKGLDVRASTTASAGLPAAAADVIVQTPAGTIEVQVKSYATAHSNAEHLANPKYAGMQQLVPAGQADAVRGRAAQRAAALRASRPERADAFAEVAERATDQVEAAGARSQPLARGGARELVENPSAMRRAMERGQWKADLQRGAVGGALAGGVISVAQHSLELCSGREQLSHAAKAVAVDTVKGAAKGAATTAGARVISNALARAGAQGLARSALPVTVAVTALDVGGGVFDYANGRIDGEELVARTGKSVVSGAAAWGGAELGAAVGTCLCPGAGTIIGGIAGALLVSLGIGKLLR